MQIAAEEKIKVERVSETTEKGRKLLRHEHDSLSSWGYEKPQRDYFYVIPPTKPAAEKVPLRVVLHSAGGSGEREMKGGLTPDMSHYIQAYCEETSYGLYLDCDTHKPPNWWWGYHAIAKNTEKYKTELSPTEKRVFAEIEWVMANFPIDPDRVYLSGVSMGGAGSLGLGMCRGDLFAAINILVPANPAHGLFRMANGKHPDPPPVFNFSAQNDAWARDQEKLIALCQSKRYFMAFAWGPHGHTNESRKFNAAVYEHPWTTIRRNEAYPVFTNATTDNKYPGFNNMTAPDQSGQINGYFRWKNITDTADQFVMELRLVRKDELKNPGDLQIPTKSEADVTLRRLQKFKAEAGTVYKWQMSVEGEVRQSGEVKLDAEGLLTIPKLGIETVPGQLKVERKR